MAERVSTASTAALACAQRSLLVRTARRPCGRMITDRASTTERAQITPPTRRDRRRWMCPASASVATV